MIIAVICYIIAIVKPLKLIIGQKYESDTDDWQWRKPNMNTVVYYIYVITVKSLRYKKSLFININSYQILNTVSYYNFYNQRYKNNLAWP